MTLRHAGQADGADRAAAQDAPGLVPGGTAPPQGLDPGVFGAVLETFLACRRLDMSVLADELGVSRATLYRRVRGRDQLLGEVIWFLTRRALVRAVRAAEGEAGLERVLGITGAFMRDVSGQPGLRRLLDCEPEAALRILTSPDGPVQPGLTRFTEEVLQGEEDAGRLAPGSAQLAFAIVRIGESFMYSDRIADTEPDVDRAVEVLRQMLHRPLVESCGTV